VLVSLVVVVGTVGYSYLEGWTPLEALYTTVVTVTTVGYGDFTPQTSAGRLFTVIFGIAAIGVAGYAVSSLAGWIVHREQSRGKFRSRERKMKQLDGLTDHIIVCGGGTICAQVAREFYKSKSPFILVDKDEKVLRNTMLLMEEEFFRHKVEQVKRLGFMPDEEPEVEQLSLADLSKDLGVPYLVEDPTEDKTLYKAGIERARGVVTVLDNDGDNLFVVLSARQLAGRVDNSKLYIVSRLKEVKNQTKLKAAGADRIISLDLTVGYQIATSMLHPEIARFWLHTLQGDQSVRFGEVHLRQHPDLVGHTVARFTEQNDQLVVAIRRSGDYIYTPALDTQLQPEDILITLVTNKPE
jgi:voltage-gated potassium channel